MIVFDLQCANGHPFEGWFEDRKAFLAQQQKGLIQCPVCNDTLVERIPSPFAIKSSGSAQPPAAEVPQAAAPAGPNIDAIGKKIAEFVENHFDDVGCDFAKEALKIHYGASEPRNIRGVSTDEEEDTLKEEGVSFYKIPIPRQSDSDA
jgi:hypothetical protein